MSANAVISCPRCLRQYQVDPTLDGKLGRCAACKAHFVVSVPRLANEGGEAVVFDREVEPHFNFFQEGCERLGHECRWLLEDAGIEVTPASVIAVIRSLPHCGEELLDEKWRRGFCSQAIESVYARHPGTARRTIIARYFLEYIPTRTDFALDMLKAAFFGVLGSMPFRSESATCSPQPPEPKRPRGPLERWAAKRGW